jgi:hypothetical protein
MGYGKSDLFPVLSSAGKKGQKSLKTSIFLVLLGMELINFLVLGKVTATYLPS